MWISSRHVDLEVPSTFNLNDFCWGDLIPLSSLLWNSFKPVRLGKMADFTFKTLYKIIAMRLLTPELSLWSATALLQQARR